MIKKINKLFLVFIMSFILMNYTKNIGIKEVSKNYEIVIPSNKINKINMNLINENVEIIGEKRNDIYISYDKVISYPLLEDIDEEELFYSIDVKLLANNQELKIEVKYNKKSKFIYKSGVKFFIKIPQELLVEIKNINGYVKLKNIFNNFDINQVNGNIDIENCQNKKIFLKTINGRIKVFNVQSDESFIDTKKGVIKIYNIKGNNLKINNINGEIILDDIFLDKAYIKIVNGEIDIKNIYCDAFIENINGDINFIVKNSEIGYTIIHNKNKIFVNDKKIIKNKYIIGNGEKNLNINTINGEFYLYIKE